MYEARDTIRDFERNRRLLRSQAEGLSHIQSLLQPPAGNCFNWVLGHIVVHRDKVISACGGRPVMDDAQTARYQNESDPVTADGEDVVAFDVLLELLDATSGTSTTLTTPGRPNCSGVSPDSPTRSSESIRNGTRVPVRW